MRNERKKRSYETHTLRRKCGWQQNLERRVRCARRRPPAVTVYFVGVQRHEERNDIERACACRNCNYAMYESAEEDVKACAATTSVMSAQYKGINCVSKVRLVVSGLRSAMVKWLITSCTDHYKRLEPRYVISSPFTTPTIQELLIRILIKRESLRHGREIP